MTGTVAKPAAVAGTGQAYSASYVNAFRVAAVTNRLLAHVAGETNCDKTEFCNLCLSLARGIDYAVTNNDVPGRAPDLPYLLKKVCQKKNDLTSQAAIMVLMISVKSACSNGWFSEKIKEELYVLSDELQSSFCSVNVKDLNSNVKTKESNLLPTVFSIMSRFYPCMKMGEIFSLVETKPGYDSYVTDLRISKSSKTSPDDKIYLFVAQMDNIDTSSCLISPQQVNFLLNGEGVDKRTCVYKDLGPQMPTPVTHMLKFGSNLLQVVGHFKGRYVIVIAFMSVVSNSTFSSIPDYIAPVATQLDSDNEILEGPSRISLKCPISFSGIKIPVKGRSCKHLQSFDFNNYVEINSRRPQWRCPHCSQPACFHDIRIDQSMVKVLKEVGEDVSHVKISGDGSWEAVTETISNEPTEKPNDAPALNHETTTQNLDDIMDLSGNDNDLDNFSKDDDIKPSPAGEFSLPVMEDGFWEEVYSSTFGTRTTNARPDVTDDVIQRSRQILNSLTQSQRPVSSNMQSQNNENSNNNNNNNGHARYEIRPTWVSAIQALPAQNFARMVDGDRQQNVSRSHLNPHASSQNQGLVPNQGHTFPQLGARSVSPQHTSGNRHTSPLSTDRFNSHQNQLLNQRAHLPVRSTSPSTHVRLGGAHTSQYSISAIQRATSQMKSQTPSIPPPVQTSGPSSVLVAAPGNQRADVAAEENWRPRMRGSLTGQQFTEALKSQSIIHPSQPVQAARPPPVMNTPRPFITPQLQALMANNNARPQSGGSGPGSDTSMAGGGGGCGATAGDK